MVNETKMPQTQPLDPAVAFGPSLMDNNGTEKGAVDLFLLPAIRKKPPGVQRRPCKKLAFKRIVFASATRPFSSSTFS